jgi:hypothetical protein
MTCDLFGCFSRYNNNCYYFLHSTRVTLAPLNLTVRFQEVPIVKRPKGVNGPRRRRKSRKRKPDRKAEAQLTAFWSGAMRELRWNSVHCPSVAQHAVILQHAVYCRRVSTIIKKAAKECPNQQGEETLTAIPQSQLQVETRSRPMTTGIGVNNCGPRWVEQIMRRVKRSDLTSKATQVQIRDISLVSRHVNTGDLTQTARSMNTRDISLIMRHVSTSDLSPIKAQFNTSNLRQMTQGNTNDPLLLAPWNTRDNSQIAQGNTNDPMLLAPWNTTDLGQIAQGNTSDSQRMPQGKPGRKMPQRHKRDQLSVTKMNYTQGTTSSEPVNWLSFILPRSTRGMVCRGSLLLLAHRRYHVL